MKLSKLIYALIIVCVFLITLNGCVGPEVVTKSTVYEKPRNLRDLYIAFMPFDARELTKSEVEDITDEIIENLSTYANIKKLVILDDDNERLRKVKDLRTWEMRYYYQENKVMPRLVTRDLLNQWSSCWEEYLNKKEMNIKMLNKIGSEIKVNSVLQFAVTDVKITRPVHRKVIGAITAQINYTLFSTNGKVLFEGNSIATQANAWSGQMVPPPIEAIDPAIDDIFKKFPFKTTF